MEDTTKRFFKISELRFDESDGKPKISGLAVPYNAPSEDLGGFREIFKPGAFRDCLKSDEDIQADVDHDGTKRIGRRSAGSLELKESREGLHVTITPPNTSVGRDVIEEVRSGLLDGMSIAFTDAQDTYKGKGHDIVREINQATLRAVTLTNYPAYRQTAGTVSIRSLDEYRKSVEAEEASKKEEELRAATESEKQASEEQAKIEQQRQEQVRADMKEIDAAALV